MFGHVALPTGAPAPNTEASTTYTVDITPAPTTTASSSATASSPPSASAPANTAAPSVSATVGNDQPGTAGTVTCGAGKGTVLKFSRAPDWWTLSWPVVVGTSILALGILTATGFPLLLMLRRRRARPASGPSKDKAA